MFTVQYSNNLHSFRVVHLNDINLNLNQLIRRVINIIFFPLNLPPLYIFSDVGVISNSESR